MYDGCVLVWSCSLSLSHKENVIGLPDGFGYNEKANKISAVNLHWHHWKFQDQCRLWHIDMKISSHTHKGVHMHTQMQYQQDPKSYSSQATAPNPPIIAVCSKPPALLFIQTERKNIFVCTLVIINIHHLPEHLIAWCDYLFPAEIKRLQGKDREAMLQLSNWHCSSSASTQKEPQKTEKPCVPVDNVTLFCNAGHL